ncbi:MAG: glycosyl transferase, partial [Oscillochloris sp.]|nr:glycosyl transferase [Oscillochloris sp.]
AVADPGPLFYPVALAFRLTPWTLLGAVLGGVALARGWPAQRVALRLLLICGLMYLLAITLLAKKFDRYALPVVPLIELLAAVGWVWAAEQLATRNARLAARATALVTGGLLALSLINLAWYHPYELSYYSPLLGGGPAAAQTIPVGWGEGYDQAMAFIVSQPDGCQRAVAVWMPTMIERYRARCWNLRSLHALRSPDNDIGYVMLYRDVIQRGLYADVVDQLASQQEPLYTVRIHGIELAYVYQLPYPIANRIDVDIGPAIRLQGYTIDAARLRTTGAITLRLQWQARAPVGQDLMLAVRLLDQAGATVAQIDVPPAGPEAPSSGWQLYKYLSRTQPLPVAGNLPAGSYWLALALYTPGDFARLTPHNPPPAPGAPAYDQTALLLGPISVP